MLPIAPLDYERYVVAHSPHLVPNSGNSLTSARTREAAPVEQLSTKLSRHNFSLQGSNQRAESYRPASYISQLIR